MRIVSFSMRARLVLHLLFACFLTGCLSAGLMPGEIASVDGQAVMFREAEARRSRLFSGDSGVAAGIGNEELQRQYRYVVGQIVEELIVCRFLKQKNIELEPGAVEAEEEKIRQDYPPGAFDVMLVEEGVDLDMWREQLRRTLSVNLYIAGFIRPEVRLTPEEIHNYYSKHQEDFILPEQWRFIQIAGIDRKEVEAARDAYLADNNASAVQKRFMVTMRDVRTALNRLPDAFRKELDALEPMKAGPIKSDGNEYRVVILLEKLPQTLLDPATVTARVESILSEEKVAEAYRQHLQQLADKAEIRVAPALLLPGERAFSPAAAARLSLQTKETSQE